MITIETSKFAENEKEFIAALFDLPNTCYGYAKRYKRKIMFFNHNKSPIGFINTHGVIGTATKLDDSRTWYSYGTPSFMPMSLIKQAKIVAALSIDKDNTGFIFK